ncbi:MAG: hypothetical protein ACK58N_10685 [Synechocystis sp.]|jgi:hypothetical protein
MSRIQIADLSSSESNLLYDVNDAEMSAILGGKAPKWVHKLVDAVWDFFVK